MFYLELSQVREFAGLRYLIRAICQVQGTIRELAVPHPNDPPGSGHDSRACGTSSERSARFRARFANLRYLIRAIRQVQVTIRELAVPHPNDPPGSGHDSRACGTSSERSARFRARFASCVLRLLTIITGLGSNYCVS